MTMAMDDWGSAPVVNKAKNMVQWFGEDVEEEVKDSWDQDAEVDEKITEQNNPQIYQNKKKIAQKKQEIVNKEKKEETSTDPVDIRKEIALREAIEMKQIAKDVFGVESITSSSDFDKFKHEILAKIEECQKNPQFVAFVENLVSGLCNQLSTSDTKRIHNILGNLHLEKCKADVSSKPIKKLCKLKAKLRVDDEIDIRSYEYCDDYFDY